MKILIVTGGNSSERPVSIRSAQNVKKALESKGHKVYMFDLRQGTFLLLKNAKKSDVIFPVIHGAEGEGGYVHKTLSEIDKPIVGTASYEALKKGWYKISFKKFCDSFGYLTSEWREIKAEQDIVSFNFPCVLKSSGGGSSKEVFMLKKGSDLKNPTIKKVIQSNKNLFVERYIKGLEITAAIFNNRCLPLIEIVPPEGQWFSYRNKYSDATKEIPFAPSISPALAKKIQKVALEIHRKLSLGDYSRIDFIVQDSKFYLLEVNTIPGLTEGSLFPKAAKAEGISFPTICESLINLAIERYKIAG